MDTHEFARVLSGRKVAQVLHGLEVRAADLFGGVLAHLRGRAPVVLAREEVDRALVDVDAGDAVARIEAAEVKVQVTVEDAVRLT